MAKILRFNKYSKITESVDFREIFNEWLSTQPSSIKHSDYLGQLRSFIQDPTVSQQMKQMASVEFDSYQETPDAYRRNI